MERYQDSNGLFQLLTMDRTLPTEITAEFTLPDYRSEISRLLSVRPTLTPPEIFVSGGKAELSGMAYYKIVYVGPDGALFGIEESGGYHFTLPLDALPEAGAVLSATCATDAVVGRVTGPRKLQIRTRIHTRLMGYGEKALSVSMEGAPAHHGEICRLCDTVKAGRLYPEVRENITVTDSADTPEDTRIISARANVLTGEVSAGDECIHVRGELVATLLLCRESDSVPYTVTRRIPFSHDMLCPDATTDHRARVTATVCEMNATVEENLLHLAPTLILCGEVQCDEELVVCRDLFLPGAAAECRFANEPLFRAGHCTNRHFSVSGEHTLSELGLENATVIDACAEAEICEKTADGARITLSGNLACHLLCRLGDEYMQKEATYPFRVTFEDDALDVCAALCVPVCRPVLSGDTLRIDAELALSSRGQTPAPVEVLASATFTPAPEKEHYGMEIYYPATGETLWDVAKRYRMAPATLSDANGLNIDVPNSPDSLAGRKYVLIP